MRCDVSATHVDTSNVGKVVSYCLEKGLKRMLTDKEGGFALVPEGVFSDKAGVAIRKNFKVVEKVSLNKVKQRAIQFVKIWVLTGLGPQSKGKGVST